MKTITINRSIWRSGGLRPNKTGTGITELLNDEGYMCCLGMYCHQVGIPTSELKSCTEPAEIELGLDKIPELACGDEQGEGQNTLFASQAMCINDGDMPREVREEELIKLGKQNNVEFVFINNYQTES